MEPITAVDLAKAFIDKLIDALTEEQWTLMIDRNRAETNPGICHSHDFCDANQVMLDAMDSLGIPYEGVDWNEDNPTTKIVNEAFAIAKAAEFDAVRITDALVLRLSKRRTIHDHLKTAVWYWEANLPANAGPTEREELAAAKAALEN